MSETMNDIALRPPSTPGVAWRGWGDVFGAAALASNGVVLWLWISCKGIQKLDVDPLATLVLPAGLLASNLMLLQVLMLARIPIIERTWGFDLLARRHRLAGFASFWLMVVHVVLTVVVYLKSGGWEKLWWVITDLPGMLMAVVGTALIIVAVALSIRKARRRLRYESWHLIHLYTYLGMGLALPHQIWVGPDFRETAWARAYWWTLYAAAAVAVLVFRVALPLWRSWRHRLRVLEVIPESPGVVSVLVGGKNLERLPLRAGQFFSWRFLDGPGWSRAHPYSVSIAPRSAFLRVTIQDVGDGSARAATLKAGTRVLVEGPYGRLTAERRTKDKLVFIAAGAGITPIRALLEEMPYGRGDATLIYRVSDPADSLFRDELTELAEQRGLKVHLLSGPRRDDTSWLPPSVSSATSDSELLALLAPDIDQSDVYLCGPPQWMDRVHDSAIEAGVPSARLHSEEFTW
ncbi:ferric reductase-like transmembrane domain-containing protein [Streptomyces sp. NPDC002018]|uniref:ferredoxin reductase family protein n=1 Tax=Streptomyces sp. NPDC002018 TaxID=3364629 RepID=UPI0036B60987